MHQHLFKHHFKPLFIFAALLILGCHLGASPAPETPIRILFIGNSYTAGQGGVADLVNRMAAERGIAVETSQVTAGGFTLQSHWNNEIGTRDRIAEGWDWVVLQEQSLRPINDPEAFFTYARLLDQDIRAMGGETYFFLTWAREQTPETQETLNDAYCEIAEELGARVVPVGMAWALALARDPAIVLHSADGSHQSDLGQYLLGMAYHRRFWDDSPVGLSHDISPHLVLTPEQAEDLQDIAVDAPRECAQIFVDGFESGTTDAWSSTGIG